mmetsp:Transcript_3512/g.8178  ORF Transcript_3512/g.8178 Transcript_3512/m.8178 type:complete len:390 (-) Transcript_3512:318-1487(-)
MNQSTATLSNRNGPNGHTESNNANSTPSALTRSRFNKIKRHSTFQMLNSKGFTQTSQLNYFQRIYLLYSLPKLQEFFISVDHRSIWRRHLAWSLRDGDHLRNAVTGRFASNMVFMSLLLGTEIGVLFSPSKPADAFRKALDEASYGQLDFWAGIILCISIGMTLSTLLANFTAWAIVGAVSPQNSHAILRSSIGLYAAQLPARLVLLSIYCFVVTVALFIFILLPRVWCFIIAIFPIALIGHIVFVYSAFGRLVMYTKAMRREEIFECEEEDSMTPKRLFEALLKRSHEEKARDTPLPLFYKTRTEITEQISNLRSRSDFVENGWDGEDGGRKSGGSEDYLEKILEVDDVVAIPDFRSDDEREQEQEDGALRNSIEIMPQSPLETISFG